jgi:hypothetical protein
VDGELTDISLNPISELSGELKNIWMQASRYPLQQRKPIMIWQERGIGIMRKKQSKMKNTKCPFLDENCLKKNCELYNTVLDRCELSLLNYNLYHCIRIKTFLSKQSIVIDMVPVWCLF